MSSTLHFQLKTAPPELWRGERFQLLVQFVLYSNERNRCWPAMDHLASNMGKSKTSLAEAKKWLVSAGAIEVVEYKQRVGKEKTLPQRQCVYQLTGRLTIDGAEYPYLYQETDNNGHVESTRVVRSKKSNRTPSVHSNIIESTEAIRTDGVREVVPSQDIPINTDAFASKEGNPPTPKAGTDHIETDPVKNAITMPSVGADRQPLSVETDPAQTPSSDVPPTIPYGFVGWLCEGDNWQQHLALRGGGRAICGCSCKNSYMASLPSETIRPVCAECLRLASMCESLAAACTKSMGLHYSQLREVALQLLGDGYEAADVRDWRVKCWPDHWKAKKDQPIPALKDVLEDIAKVRVLPDVIEIAESPYLADAYFADRETDDDRPNPFVRVDELPPRNIQAFTRTDKDNQSWHATKGQLEVQLNQATFGTYIRPIEAIGHADDNTLVLEAKNEYVAEWFHKHIEHSVLETFNRIARRGDGHKKPSIQFVVVLEGDNAYREVV